MVFLKEEGGYIKIKKNKDGKKLSILKGIGGILHYMLFQITLS